MMKLVVNSVEDLKAIRNGRPLPAILIETEFANNLLVSGGISISAEDNIRKAQVVRLSENTGPMAEVIEILHDLSKYNDFVLSEGPKGTQIRIYPKIVNRREGN
jgi:hypothetical protein